MVNVVLVGCGAMSKAWLEAAESRLASIADRRPCRSRRRRRAQARAREFDLDGARSAPISTRCSSRRKPDVRVRRGRSRRAPRRRALGLRPWLPCAHRKAAGRQPGRMRAPSSSAARAGRAHPRRRPEPPLSSPMSGASGAFIDSGAIGAPTQHPLRLLRRRRISAASARRCDHVLLLDMAIHTFDAARFMVGRRAARRLLPRMGAGATPGTAQGVGGQRDLRIRRRRGLHLSRQLVRRRRSAPAGKAPGGSSASKRHADLGRLRRRSQAEVVGRTARAFFDQVEPIDGARRSIRATASAAISA